MAEMGSTYQNTQYCWHMTSANSPTNIFSAVNFLKLAAESWIIPLGAICSTLGDSTTHSETRTIWADHISTLNRIAGSESVIYLRTGEITRSDASCPILKHHDQNKFEIWCIDSTLSHDWISKQLMQHANHWLNIKHLNDYKHDYQMNNLIFSSNSEVSQVAHVLIVWSIGHAPFN